MRVGITFDLKENHKLNPGLPKDFFAEFDNWETVEYLEQAIRMNGHSTIFIGDTKNLIGKIEEALNCDIIFNIAEGISGRSREAQVPAILELFEIPYVGSDPLTQALTLDKLMTKKVVSFHRIRTPKFWDGSTREDLEGFNLEFPVIVKPRYEGTSKSLNEDSVVSSFAELEERVLWLTRTYNQPALIEEFIKGKEFTCAIIGNENPVIFPLVQIEIHGELELGMRFYTNDLVESPGVRYVCPAKIPDEKRKEIEETALEVYRAVDCRDFGRVDFRMDEKGNPYFLECNPIPSLSRLDVFPLVSETVGSTYEKTIGKIVEFALIRQKIKDRVTV